MYLVSYSSATVCYADSFELFTAFGVFFRWRMYIARIQLRPLPSLRTFTWLVIKILQTFIHTLMSGPTWANLWQCRIPSCWQWNPILWNSHLSTWAANSLWLSYSTALSLTINKIGAEVTSSWHSFPCQRAASIPFVSQSSDLLYALVTEVLHEISCYTGRRYNGTRLCFYSNCNNIWSYYYVTHKRRYHSVNNQYYKYIFSIEHSNLGVGESYLSSTYFTKTKVPILLR